jgi:hypothetical protein
MSEGSPNSVDDTLKRLIKFADDHIAETEEAVVQKRGELEEISKSKRVLPAWLGMVADLTHRPLEFPVRTLLTGCSGPARY